MSTPIVPPRPARAQAGPTAVNQQPQIPPRPVRKTDPSPDREAYTRSPLNFPAANGFHRPPPMPTKMPENGVRRPSSIALPSEVGQEGLEYTSYDQLPDEAHSATGAAEGASEQTRNVSADVPLHAPKASVPQSTAKSRIATVTRTDSTQAAAAGIGRAAPDDDVHNTPSDSGAPLGRVTSRTYDDHLRRVPSTEPHPLRARSSFNRSTSSLHNGTPRPPSMHSVDHPEGIPEIGMQIPLYPNAGDVQAPSPAPTQSQHTPGIGFFNDGSQRAHHRKRSSRQEFGPPGSYGLHGHGSEPVDQFEREWLMKHPDEALKAGYSPYMLRPETALSTEELNKIVRENQDIGMGTSPAAIGTPSQEIAFEATEQFASRMNSPRPSPAPISELKKRPSSGHQAAVESPLRQSFPFRAASTVESEDDDVIHVMPPARRGSKVTGGGAMDNTIDLGPTGGNTAEAGGYYDERGEGTPILASDEITKRPGSAYLQPAVEPEASDDYDSDYIPSSRRSSLQPPSRPSSRPGSTHSGWHGGPLHRFISHEEHHGSGMGTPLEEIEEYEPLFPEGEEEKVKPKEAYKQRPGLEHHHFPSQDIWEDTPSSLQYQTTVQTPEPPAEKIVAADGKPAQIFETPEQEQRRRDANPEDMTSDNKTFAKPHFKSAVHDDLQRPGVNRFPSRDIWEDTPDSMRLVTTVSSPQMDDTKSPPEDRPTTSALLHSHDDPGARTTTSIGQPSRPSIPSRPERKSRLAQEIKPEPEAPQNDDVRAKEVPDLGSTQEQMPDRTKPTVPDRPKPTVPARPSRPSHSDQAEGAEAPLSMTASTTSIGSAGSGASDETVTSPPVPKAKPAVPARPAGSKIAALQAGFMNDLNNRLKLGPQGPPPKAKEPEDDAPAEETAKEPLTDARKGRARGPARRKPAASPSAAVGGSGFGFSMSTPMTLWHIDEKDELNVPSAEAEATEPKAALERAMTENEVANTQEPPMTTMPPGLEEKSGSTEMKEELSASQPETIGAHGDQPPPSISLTTADEQKAIQPELEASLANAEAAPKSAEETESKQEKEMVSSAVQTGQTDMSIKEPTGETATMTAYVGGKAPEEGDVVVKESA